MIDKNIRILPKVCANEKCKELILPPFNTRGDELCHECKNKECENCKCDNCTNQCQNCVECKFAEDGIEDDTDLKLLECESYSA